MDPLMFILDLGVLYSIYAILAISVEIEYGELGIPNFAKSAMYAIGAFSVGALATRLGVWLTGVAWEGEFKSTSWIYATMVSERIASSPMLGVVVFVVPLIVAMPLAALLGLLASYPALRLREDYLGITLIAFSELVRVFVRNYEPLLGGTFGAGVPNFLAFLPVQLRSIALFLLSVAFLAGIWVAYYRLTTSPFGRVLRAIRDNEVAAQSLGRDIVKIRAKVLTLGSVLAAIAGVLYAFYVGSVNPDDFTVMKTFIVILMVVIGGKGNPLGPLVGAGIYIALDRTITFAKQLISLPFDINYFSYIIFGLLLILVVMVRPGGLVPERPPVTVRER
ncbi:branched-chain amino acid ABC transporter permease [Infirmifilum lucidum]|uniref:Branched-chain amino acid ABC transporter permease n=1 Tax=Infirmifilum lucidum TaxID=2776706 RepID=A0A7L9FGZ6_9CREN|nr:branched-chain amino acid ABC transporter permease [Infirmifilum lucidum]QOJ78065.1 branched-chain amino acid ABC transporter permease [Infirmifilum lucidum]